jgi:hypothetical protein
MRDHIDSTYERINVSPGKIHYNYRCHLNAVHYARKKKDKKLALVLYRENNSEHYSVHFVNYHNKVFVDNTIGYWAKSYEYRFIRWVNENEYDSVMHILSDTKRVFIDKGTFLEKLFGDLSI